MKYICSNEIIQPNRNQVFHNKFLLNTLSPYLSNFLFSGLTFSFYSTGKINEFHDMGNAWAFPSISYSTEKCSKTHRMGKTWEIGNHTFPIVWVLFFHLIPILWYTSSYGKCMGFPINFPWYGKMQQNPSYGENLGNW